MCIRILLCLLYYYLLCLGFSIGYCSVCCICCLICAFVMCWLLFVFACCLLIWITDYGLFALFTYCVAFTLGCCDLCCFGVVCLFRWLNLWCLLFVYSGFSWLLYFVWVFVVYVDLFGHCGCFDDMLLVYYCCLVWFIFGLLVWAQLVALGFVLLFPVVLTVVWWSLRLCLCIIGLALLEQLIVCCYFWWVCLLLCLFKYGCCLIVCLLGWMFTDFFGFLWVYVGLLWCLGLLYYLLFGCCFSCLLVVVVLVLLLL